MKKLCFLILSIISLSAFAQLAPKHMFAPHNGGNGGDDDEIMIKNTLLQIGTFLDSSDGKALFGQEVDSRQFLETVTKVDIRVIEDELTDKFNLKRCALNFPEEQLAVFNRACLDKLRNNVNDLYVLLTHEILNIMGLELPDERSGSIYPISTKIGAIGPLVIARSKMNLFSSHCKIAIREWELNHTVPQIVKTIIKGKGFNLVKDTYADEGQYFVLNVKLMSEKKDHYLIENDILTLSKDKKIKMESSFIKNMFNGLIAMHILGTEIELFAPTPVRIKEYGNQYRLQPKGFWKESIVELYMKLPSCVKY